MLFGIAYVILPRLRENNLFSAGSSSPNATRDNFSVHVKAVDTLRNLAASRAAQSSCPAPAAVKVEPVDSSPPPPSTLLDECLSDEAPIHSLSRTASHSLRTRLPILLSMMTPPHPSLLLPMRAQLSVQRLWTTSSSLLPIPLLSANRMISSSTKLSKMECAGLEV